MPEIAEALQRTGVALAAATERIDAAAREARRQFWLTIGGVLTAIVVVVAVGTVLVIGQRSQDDDLAERARISRDRQQCATALMVNYMSHLGDFLNLATVIPRTPRTSIEFEAAVGAMNEATALLKRADDLCYGPIPDPNPVN